MKEMSRLPYKRFKETSWMVVHLHFSIAGERIGGHLGQTKFPSSDGLLTFLTFGRTLSYKAKWFKQTFIKSQIRILTNKGWCYYVDSCVIKRKSYKNKKFCRQAIAL